jgi:ABC-type antimicrobial peptide transport system permease subunit
MALGAASTDVLRLVLRDALRLALAGIVLGCGLAFAVAQGLRGMLFGVQPADPFVFVAVPIALLLTAVLASAVPARRAAAIDPMLALRAD